MLYDNILIILKCLRIAMTSHVERKLFAKISSNSKAKNNTVFKVEVDAKKRKAKFTTLSHSWTHNDDGAIYHYPQPYPYTIDEYIAIIFKLINDNNLNLLGEYLKSYFIYPESITDDIFLQCDREVTVEEYKIHNIAPLMEIIILEHPIIFEQLLETSRSTPDCHNLILNSLEDLNLSGATFSNLNLAHANFKNSNLRGATFTNTDLTDANLAFCQLDNCTGLTPEKLDTCATYQKAVLPKNIWPYWDKDIRENIRLELLKLKKHGKKLCNDHSSLERGQKIITHAETMLNELNAVENINVNHSFKKNFINKLYSDKNLTIHRDYGVKVILTNIALCIIGAGIGYLIAAGIHKLITNRFFFFERTNSQEKLDKVTNYITGKKNLYRSQPTR